MENIVEMLGGNLLSYGVSGFALLMIGFTYYLMNSELKREEPRKIAIKTIWMFMGLVLLSTVVVGFFSLPIADKNEELNQEVSSLTTDMSLLMEMVSRYEYAINDLTHKLEDNSDKPNPNPTRPPKYTGPDMILDTGLLAKHVDFTKYTTPEMYSTIRANDADESDKEEFKKAVKTKLNTSQFQQINTDNR